MNKNWVVLLGCVMALTARTQTLFTYGKYSVDAKDFLRAYNKNNVAPAANKAKAINEYLNLYIASRLKIREAYDRGYDTLHQLKDELANLRSQITETYMNDPESVTKLVDQAFQRSQKDIHAAHIYVSFRNAVGQVDSVNAKKKINEALQMLQKGKDFSEVALQYSEDPSAKINKGDLGFISVFTLPYEFESIIYSTPATKYSGIYKSKSGYHIFKNMGERKPLGKMKASQILLALPPDADDATKKQIAHLADSLYNRLMGGDDFEKLAVKFSNDYITASAGGLMPEFSVGQYDPLFEKTVFGLPKNGAISKPFQTSHGFHIVKRMSITPIATDPKNKNNMLDLRTKVEQSDRVVLVKDVLVNKVMKSAGFKKLPYSNEELFAFTDSLIDFRPPAMHITMKRESPLFKIGDHIVNVQDWVNYAQTYRYKSDGSGAKPYSQVMDEFISFLALDYYRNHLEDYNEEFRNQVTEFRDGNLFFEIMQREIWNRAQSDTMALQKFYEKNKSRYVWNKSADAVIFFCTDESTASQLYAQLKKSQSAWKSLAASMGERVIIDSSRYELAQIPDANKTILKEGVITTPLVNKTDNSASFAYILKLYPNPAPRNFVEARGLVINDFQNQAEEQWIKALKVKYPVKVNEKVLQSLVNSK